MKAYDLIIIGAGAGGLTAAASAASLGAKVALIEKEKKLGGDCLHYGCVPSKALIESAKKIHTAHTASEEFGFEIQGQADFSIAIGRVKAAIAHIQKHDDPDRFRSMGVDVFHGFGRFKDAHHVEISGEEVIRGKKIVISTGSRPSIPPIENIENVNFFTNETIFDLEALPRRLVVIGAGPIGLELSQSMARFGSQVTVVEYAPDLFGREDEEIVPYIRDVLEKELNFLFNAQVKHVEETDQGEKKITLRQGEEEITLYADEILVAAGRSPNTDNLGLEQIGVKTENGYVAVKNTLQTSIPHIYAIGDVIQAFPFTHAAGMEAIIVVGNAILGLHRKVNYDSVPWVTYTDPEVFHLGLTENEARETHGDQIQVYRVSLDKVDRFVADRDVNGLVKVITDKKGIILGAHAVGKGAGDWMQEIVYAKQSGHTFGKLSRLIHPYPTHGAVLQQAAVQYVRKKFLEGWILQFIQKYIRWFR